MTRGNISFKSRVGTGLQSFSHYYAFGSLMPGRNYNSSSYNYSVNGQEKVDEITGVTGSHTTALFWEYDTRLGRRWNRDPKPNASTSEYACFANNPIFYTDVNGDTVRYNSFSDKVMSFIGRLTSKDYRADFNRMKSSTSVYTLKGVSEKPSMRDGGSVIAVDNGFEYQYGTVGSPIEFEEREFSIGGKTKEVEVIKKKSFVDENKTEIDDGVTLKRRVPGTHVTLNALDVPDEFTVVEKATGNVLIQPVLLGGTDYEGTNGKTMTFTPSTSNTIEVQVHSNQINPLIPSPSPTANAKSRNTEWRVTYTKYIGINWNFKIKIPVIK